MKKRKKYVPAFFQVYENDALKNYLEFMAGKGWRLKSVGSMLLCFEACAPCRIRYCVEVMDKPSAYASNQTEKLKTYREFCRDAGWEFAGSTGFLHIFYSEDDNAILVETDPKERYERICQACQGTIRMFAVLLGIIVAMNLYSCYREGTLLCLNGWVAAVILCAAGWSVGEFSMWKKKAGRSVEESGVLPCIAWTYAKRKNCGAVVLTLVCCSAPLIYTLGRYSSWMLAGVMVWYLVYVGLLLLVFTRVLYWVREKRAYTTKANIIIYWGIGLAAGAVLCTGFLALLFHMM